MTTQLIVRTLFEGRIKLQALAWAIVRDHHLTEDLLQDVIVKALGQASEFRDSKHLLKWANVTIRNLAIDLYRKKNRRAKLLEKATLDLVDSAWDTEDSHSENERLEILRNCLSHLPDKTQEALTQRYYQNLTVQEIADRMGKNREAIYQLLSRAHRRLRECMHRQSHSKN